jgi:hypothetical protein
MTKLLRGGFALLLVIFLSACPTDDTDPTDGSSVPTEKVKTPVIGMNPNRPFNNGPINISFTSSTSGAEFYYTLDGSTPSSTAGTKYNGSFPLEPDNVNIHDTPHRGSIQVRVIGIKEGLYNSSIISQNFQLFETEPAATWENKTTAMVYGEGQGHEGTIRVGLQLKDGILDAESITIEDGYNGTSNDTADLYTAAKNRAKNFWELMNHWDFDAVSGATDSSNGIRAAAKAALTNAGVIEE